MPEEKEPETESALATFIKSPAFAAFAKSGAARLVAVAGGALIAKGFLTKEQVGLIDDQIVLLLVGAVLSLASIAYGWSQQYIQRRKLLKAMAMPFPVTEKDLEARIKVGGAPSITTPKDELPGPSTKPLPVETPPPVELPVEPPSDAGGTP